MSSTILLIEDNINVQKFNSDLLREEGYEVLTASTLKEAREKISIPDLIVLDVGMPDGSGLDFLLEIRKNSDTPVLILSGFSQDTDVVSGFNKGCDDYLAKPYSFDVLLARIKRLMQTHQKPTAEIIKGGLTLDVDKARAKINGADLHLTLKQFSLLKILVEKEGESVSFDSIYDAIWGQQTEDNTKVLVNTVYRLRKKLTNSGYTIKSEYGNGYVFEKK